MCYLNFFSHSGLSVILAQETHDHVGTFFPLNSTECEGKRAVVKIIVNHAKYCVGLGIFYVFSL